jgi:hypothetical protein
MSRHHIHLPPITYVPVPKKIEKRRRRGQIQSDGSIEDAADIADIVATTGVGQPRSAANKPSPENFASVDVVERRPDQPSGLLSQATLKAMLQVQEKET